MACLQSTRRNLEHHIRSAMPYLVLLLKSMLWVDSITAFLIRSEQKKRQRFLICELSSKHSLKVEFLSTVWHKSLVSPQRNSVDGKALTPRFCSWDRCVSCMAKGSASPIDLMGDDEDMSPYDYSIVVRAWEENPIASNQPMDDANKLTFLPQETSSWVQEGGDRRFRFRQDFEETLPRHAKWYAQLM